MIRLDRTPSRDGYSVSIDPDARSASVRGRLPRTRRDQIGSALRVSVAFSFSQTEISSFMAFYERVSFTGEEFVLELITGDMTLRDHVCKIVPGTLGRSSLGGARTRVNFEVEAAFLSEFYTTEHDAEIIETFALDQIVDEGFLNLLAELVNEDWPE